MLVGGTVLAACQGVSATLAGDASSATPDETSATGFRIGGQASGLAGTVTLASDALGSLDIREDGPFWMPQALPSGTAFEVAVSQPPSGQGCDLRGGQGTVGDHDADAMQLHCQDANRPTDAVQVPWQDANRPVDTFVLAVAVSGLDSSSEVTVSDGATSVALGNGTHPFGPPRAAGAAFHLALQSPLGYSCQAAVLVGVMLAAPTTVAVSCMALTYPLTFVAAGLPANGIVAVGDSNQTVQLTAAAPSTAWQTQVAYRSGITVYAQDVTRFSRCRFAGDSATFTGEMPAGAMQVPLTCTPFLHLASGQPAQQVFAQPDFFSSSYGGGATRLTDQWGPAAVDHTGAIYLPDPGHRRIVGFHAWPTGNGAPFDFVLGAADLNAAADNTLPGYPDSVCAAGDRLAVGDVASSAVQIYGSLARASQAPQATLGGDHGCNAAGISRPENVAMTSTALAVTDSNLHRVLIWTGIPTSDNAPAAIALGQPDLATCASPGNIDGSTLQNPFGVWTGPGLTVVTDTGYKRVLVWHQSAETLVSRQPADVVLGAADASSQGSGAATASSLLSLGVTSNGTQLFVTDQDNSRVLVWNKIPTVDNQPADLVLGQPDFTSGSCNRGGSPNASTLCSPTGITVTTDALLVADRANFRTLVYRGQ